MNIYRPCVCLVLRKLHNIWSQTLMIACSDAKKHTYTISTVGKKKGGSGWRLGSTPSVTSNTSLCGAITSSRLSPPGGGRESERWPLGDVGVNITWQRPAASQNGGGRGCEAGGKLAT